MKQFGQNEWWRSERSNDPFEDANEYGYVATQLSHLPRCIGYDTGNMLLYLPVYDVNGQCHRTKESINSRWLKEIFLNKHERNHFEDNPVT